MSKTISNKQINKNGQSNKSVKRENSEIFIEKYKELERIAQERYKLKDGISSVYYLETNKEYADIKDKICYCREVRNFLQHETKVSKEFAIIPSDEMIVLIDEVIERVRNPIKAYDICVKVIDVYYKDLNDNVYLSMMSMDHRKYTHIPILEKGIVVGMFSKSTIFNLLIDNKAISVDKTLTFKDIKEEISLDNNDSKSEKYMFISRNTTKEHISELFETSYKNADRIAVMLVTENGKNTEKLLGIITPYDVIKKIK